MILTVQQRSPGLHPRTWSVDALLASRLNFKRKFYTCRKPAQETGRWRTTLRRLACNLKENDGNYSPTSCVRCFHAGQLLKTWMWLVAGVRHTGQIATRAAQPAHAHWWPHGTKACVAGLLKQIEHSASGASSRSPGSLCHRLQRPARCSRNCVAVGRRTPCAVGSPRGHKHFAHVIVNRSSPSNGRSKVHVFGRGGSHWREQGRVAQLGADVQQTLK